MSGVGSKSGTPPIGHGPNAVVRSTKHQDDIKHKEKRKDKNQDQQQAEKEGHDEFAVRMDASLYHLKKDAIFEGWVTKIEAEQKFLFDSKIGSFRLKAAIKLNVGDKAVIRVIKSTAEIECVIISGAGIQLTVPIHAIMTPLTLHANAAYNQDAQPVEEKPLQTATYAPQEKPLISGNDLSQEDAAVLISGQTIDKQAIDKLAIDNQTIESHASSHIHPPKIKDTSPLASQDLSSLIEASTSPTETRVQPVLKKQAGSVHDERPSLSFFYQVYKNKFPDEADELSRLIQGGSGMVPSGLAFFFAGVIFKDVKSWLGVSIYTKMADHPALKALEDDFANLVEHVHCLANEKWRLVVFPHPDGGEDRAINIISNIQSGHTHDGDHIDMRTLFTQLNFQQHHGTETHTEKPTEKATEKPYGQMQVEATMLPQHYGLTLRFARDLSDDERRDIEQLARFYFTKAGLKGHVLFAPFTSDHLGFHDTVNDLTMMDALPPLST